MSARSTMLPRAAMRLARRALATHAPVTSAAPRTSAWTPPVPAGTCPAYDEALKFIADYQSEVQGKIAQAQASSSNLSAASRSALVDSLTVASQINDPKVRWAFENSSEDQLDLSDPTTRHLRERAWRKNGSLDKLIERLRDQRVIPDAISHLTPTIDVQLILGSIDGPGVGDRTERQHTPSGDVHPGVMIEQSHLLQPPSYRLTSFGEEDKKYTLILVDLDVANATSVETRALWAVTDIPLSRSLPRLLSPSDLLGGREVLPYLPPHPAKGSGRHRYTTILLEQPSSGLSDLSSRSVDIRGLVEAQSYQAAGIHFYRSEWSEASRDTISKVWVEQLGLEEEHWGRIPRQERKNRSTANLAAFLAPGATATRKEYEIKGFGTAPTSES